MGSPTLAHVLLLLLSIHPILSNANQMEADKIDALPGQPAVDFDQYSGYITVDPNAGRALFYYFVESQNSSTKPLVLWLDGGPACSALGFGAMAEMGPFRVNKSGKSLYINDYAWNKVANVIYLEAPAGTGFSYSNTSSDYENLGDEKNPTDTYTFILNWLERFPQYQGRDLYLAGQSYAGHFVPLLAYAILQNKSAKQTAINLRGIALGNALIDQNTLEKGIYDYYWTHGFISDETHTSITKTCDFISGNLSVECERYKAEANEEIGHLNKLDIYGPICHRKSDESESGYVGNFDPCTLYYVEPYLNLPEVQQALHAKNTSWIPCRHIDTSTWGGLKLSILPTLQYLIGNGVPIWLYSGDTDGVVPITSTRYAINALKLPVKTAWRAWYSADEVGGYVVEYEGLVLTTIRGAGHTAPSYQPERALTMISSFLNGTLPPARTNAA